MPKSNTDAMLTNAMYKYTSNAENDVGGCYSLQYQY